MHMKLQDYSSCLEIKIVLDLGFEPMSSNMNTCFHHLTKCQHVLVVLSKSMECESKSADVSSVPQALVML